MANHLNQKKIILVIFLMLSITMCVTSQEIHNLAILDVIMTNVTASESSIVQGYIVDAIHDLKDYEILERSDLQQALEELNLSLSGFIDESSALEFGKITGADSMLLSELGYSNNKYFLSLRVVDTETGKITHTSIQSVKSFNNANELVRKTINELFGYEKKKLTAAPYWSVAADVFAPLPIGVAASVLNPGIAMIIDASFNLDYRWGTLSFGIFGGGEFLSTKDSVSADYNLFPIPFALSFRYRTAFSPVFSIETRLAAGGAYSVLSYSDSAIENISNISFYWSARAGGLFNLSESFALRVFCDFSWIDYSKDPLMTISPGMGALYSFRKLGDE